MNQRRIVSNLLMMGSSQVASFAISAVYFMLISRYLGPDRYGELALASAIVAIVSLVVGLGMRTFVTRAIARTPERTDVIVSASMFVRGALLIPVPIGLYAYLHFSGLDAVTITATYICMISMALSQVGSLMQSTFQGHEKMSFVALSMALSNILGLVGAVVVVALHGGVVAFTVAGVGGTLVLLFLDLYWGRRYVKLTRHVSLSDIREVVLGSLAFWASDLFLTFYTYIDAVILGSIAGSQAVGFYGPATRLYEVSMFVPSILATVTLPLLSRLGVQSGSDLLHTARKTLTLLITCAVPLTVGLIAFAGPIVDLMFGPAYQPSVSVLIILSVCIPLTYLNIQFYQVLTARDQQGRWTLVMAASCVINPLINFISIRLAVHYLHNGAVGAALSLLITEGLMTAYGAVMLRDVVVHPVIGRTVSAALLAGAAQAVILRLAGSPPIIVMTVVEVVAALTYLAIAVTLGALPRRDITLLWNTALRRPERIAA